MKARKLLRVLAMAGVNGTRQVALRAPFRQIRKRSIEGIQHNVVCRATKKGGVG